MDVKKWYASRTVWFNVIATILDILALTQFGAIIPATWAPYLSVVQGAGNILLRRLSAGTPMAFTEAGRRNMAGMLVLLLTLGAVGCAARTPPNATPAQAEQVKLRELARVATISERVGKLVEALQTTEITFHQRGSISVADHRLVQYSLKVTADTVVDALERMKDLTQPEASRRQWIGVARVAVDRLINEGIVPIVDPDARIELRLIASAISSILVTIELMGDASPPGQIPRVVFALEPLTLEASWRRA